MATEFRAIRRIKPTSSDATSSNDPTPEPEGDHRKRRRNRTTQSCLNCHNSKRMCDRKRPCRRCTQLGLTGLCVYEVDSPSQRDADAQDEGSRLRQRIAELEGVIRELKNKPHPRWAKAGSSPRDGFEKCHARSRSSSQAEDPPTESRNLSDASPPSLMVNLGAELNEPPLEKPTPNLTDGAIQPDYFPPSFSVPPPTGNLETALSTLPYSPSFDIYSPPSDPSACLVAPVDEHPQVRVVATGGHQLINGNDLASFLTGISFPDLLTCNEGQGHVDPMFRLTHGQHVDPRLAKYSHGQFLPVNGHGGCLNENSSYNVMLELSLRLRRAADILSHSASANHRLINTVTGYSLNQPSDSERMTELDAFATTVLGPGNITSSPNDFDSTQCAHLRSRSNSAPSGPISPAFSTNSLPTIRVPAASPPPLRSSQPAWNGVACAPTDMTAPGDESSFMTWEPSRQV